MRNIIITFFKVSGLTMIAGLSSFMLLLLLFSGSLRESLFLTFIVFFLGGFTACMSFILIYLPIFYLNKNLFEQEGIQRLFEKFLPLAIAPITGICLIFMLTNPGDFFEADTLFIVSMGYIITYFSFYQFIRIIKD